MTSKRIGVAISTTGDEHRLGFLETAVRQWCELPGPGVHSLFVTVDGDEEAAARVAERVYPWTGSVYRVGQPITGLLHTVRDGRLGVAVNKNTGLELLMAVNGLDHLFLSDDDIWPRKPEALELHTSRQAYSPMHSMVCWGRQRLVNHLWTWPRGSLLYASRAAVQKVGGMVEAFGPGGHEHVEWSRRFHQHGLTPVLYPAPSEYQHHMGRGAAAYWHAEDMPGHGEPMGNLRARRRKITSVRRQDGDWGDIERVMILKDHDLNFVPYHAISNGRTPATLTAVSA